MSTLIEQERIKSARILIVDDQENDLVLARRFLERSGYRNCKSVADPRCVLSSYLDFKPDLILTDIHMPHFDGIAIIEQLGGYIPKGTYVPILALTGDITDETKRRALSAGAKDFLSKPLNSTEGLLRIRNVLETRFLHLELEAQNRMLTAKVRERTRDLEESQAEILKRLALATEYRDDQTGRHAHRVGHVSAVIARGLGLSEEQLELIRKAAPLHDVGKVGLPDRILLKPGKLTVEERKRMQTHTAIGSRILGGSSSPLLRLAEEIALYHHERWDGSGYAGLSGEETPLVARIVGVADTLDALTHARYYKPAWPLEKAVAEMTRLKGVQFEPCLIDALLEQIEMDREVVEQLEIEI